MEDQVKPEAERKTGKREKERKCELREREEKGKLFTSVSYDDDDEMKEGSLCTGGCESRAGRSVVVVTTLRESGRRHRRTFSSGLLFEISLERCEARGDVRMHLFWQLRCHKKM